MNEETTVETVETPETVETQPVQQEAAEVVQTVQPQVSEVDEEAWAIGRAHQLIQEGKIQIPSQQPQVQAPTIPGTKIALPENWSELDEDGKRALTHIAQAQEAQWSRQLDERDNMLMQQMAPVIRSAAISDLSSGLDRSVVESVVAEIEKDIKQPITNVQSPALRNLIREAAAFRQGRQKPTVSVADNTRGTAGPSIDSDEAAFRAGYKQIKGREPSDLAVQLWKESRNG